MPKYECYVSTPINHVKTTIIRWFENDAMALAMLNLGGWTVLFIRKIGD